jgi:dynein heavy chain
VYIKGLFLEGAGFDQKNSVLREAEPMQLVFPMPSIHFKPSESKKKSTKGGLTTLYMHVSISSTSSPQSPRRRAPRVG